MPKKKKKKKRKERKKEEKKKRKKKRKRRRTKNLSIYQCFYGQTVLCEAVSLCVCL
jgi:hypothetical protein